MPFNFFKKKQKEERNNECCNYYNNALMFGNSAYLGNSYAMKLSAFYRGVNVIADSIASLPIEIQQDHNGWKETLYKHPSFNVLSRKPNQLMDRYTFMKNVVTDILLSGNGYAYIKRDASGNVKELQYLPANGVTLMYNELTEDLWYVSAKVQGVKRIEPKDMLHFKYYTEANGVRGLSVLTFARQSLGIATDAENAAEKFFKSGLAQSGYLKSAVPISDIQKEQIRQSWNSTQNGQEGIPVLPANLSYESISLNSVDAELLESRKFSVLEIARFLGVQPSLLMDFSYSSYSTLEASQLAFLTQTLLPWLAILETEFTTKLFPDDGSMWVNLDEKKLVLADKASEASYYNTLFNIGVLSPNEIRKILGFSQLSSTEANETYLQLNLAPAKELGKDETSSVKK